MSEYDALEAFGGFFGLLVLSLMLRVVLATWMAREKAGTASLAFSAGLASVLIAIGLGIIYAKQWIPESKNMANSPLLRIMPVLSAFVILLVGLLMTAASLGWVKPEGLFG